jgi:hypothetical protein
MLMTLDTAKSLLGVPAKEKALDPQIEFALEVASSLIVDYTGRRLVRAEYVETFYPPQTFTRHGHEHGFFSLLEFPVESVARATVNGADRLLTGMMLHRAVGLLKLPGIGVGDTVQVDYVAGYAKLPADLAAVVLELTRRQLQAMNVDLSTVGGAAASAAPIRAVSVGQLRVEYAMSMTSEAARGVRSPVTSEVLGEFATVLDMYRSSRRILAAPV